MEREQLQLQRIALARAFRWLLVLFLISVWLVGNMSMASERYSILESDLAVEQLYELFPSDGESSSALAERLRHSLDTIREGLVTPITNAQLEEWMDIERLGIEGAYADNEISEAAYRQAISELNEGGEQLARRRISESTAIQDNIQGLIVCEYLAAVASGAASDGFKGLLDDAGRRMLVKDEQDRFAPSSLQTLVEEAIDTIDFLSRQPPARYGLDSFGNEIAVVHQDLSWLRQTLLEYLERIKPLSR